MKTLTKLLLILMVVPSLYLLSSCEKKSNDLTGTGTAEFSVSITDTQNSKSAKGIDSSNVSFQVMISVEDLQGHAVYTDKLIPLYIFGYEYISENLEIRAGEFRLTKFMIINPSGEVIYAAPLAGSPLAYLTTKPLPFNFNIFPNQVTKVFPEVLAVNGQSPDQFGYVSFGIQVVNPLEFWTMCVLDPGNPLIMAPIQLTTAKLTIYAADGWHYTFKLEAGINHLVIRGGSERYNFVLEKEGFLPQKMEFSAMDLIAATKDNPLILKISWFSQYKTLILQPGPEKGKDAMISNLEPDKNFGDHKYFEATFLSEPILTVMRSNRSLIYFSPDSLPKSAIIRKVMLRLSYDLPIPFDSIYILNTGPAAGIVWYGGVLQQIVEPWAEHKVTWNTQPKTIETNQVYIPPFIRNVNFIDVDVTRLFVNPTATDQAVYPNYGMLFRLWPIDRFPGFRFASSDFPEPKMRPMLTIYYSLN
jgi:hypothetical protein